MKEKEFDKTQVILIAVMINLIVLSGMIMTKRVLQSRHKDVSKNVTSNIIESADNWTITDISDYKDEKVEKISLNNGDTKTINLEDQYYKIILDDKLKFDLIGEKIKGNQYKYYAYFYDYTGSRIGGVSSLEEYNDKVIPSSNIEGSTFTISKFQDLYIFKAKVKSEKNGEYVAIYNEDGNCVFSAYDVTSEFDKDLENIKIKKCISDNCVTSIFKLNEEKKYIIYNNRDKDITQEEAIELLKSLGKDKLSLDDDFEKYEVSNIILMDEKINQSEITIGAYKITIKKDTEIRVYRIEKTGIYVGETVGYEGFRIV